MKKILAIILVMAVAATLAACGPNSNYYNLKNINIYYYNDQPLEVNLYDQLLNTLKDNDELKLIRSSIRENLVENYYVEVEYRKVGETQYKSMSKTKVTDFAYLKDDMLYSDDPGKILGNKSKYEFKIHFIDRETKSMDTMLNLIGEFTFLKSPANAFVHEKIVKGDTYNLLDNIVQYSGENQVDLTKLYTIVFSVTFNGQEIPVTDDGEVTVNNAGTYDVTVVLTQMSEDSAEADATTSASPSGESDSMVLTIIYKIIVE